ncbi:MAG: flagellar filament capping protein FliD [gamma proteobacterium symbiont of Taylorina sp.]|nr:flagellar filament capping protein FliD [gamma proteobacterium symbiont of Taylorina sp.]
MASLSLGGVNLDVQGLVAQLMQVESTPLIRLQQKESEYQSQLSAFGRLKSALSSFQDSMGKLASLDKFETYKVSTSESDTAQSFTASVDSNAVSGSFSVEVKTLAVANKFGSNFGNDPHLNFFSSITDVAVPTAIATDTLNIDDSSGNTPLSIDIEGKSLTQIRDAINTAADTQDIGVSASIIKQDDNKYQLVLSATETGDANQIFLSGNAVAQLNLAESQTSEDATILVDNAYTISSASNKIENAISGVTLNLLKVSGTAADMTIETDIDKAKESLNGFVSGFNTLLSTINNLKENGLEGDSSLNSILSSIRSEFNSSAGLSSSFNFLSEVGITSDAKTGELKLGSSQLDKAVSTDYEAISQLFANDSQGIAFRLEEKMDDYLSFDGLIKVREEGLRSRIDYNEDAQFRMEYRLEQIEARYLKQFSNLDSIISASNATSSYLTQQLSNLPGFTRT